MGGRSEASGLNLQVGLMQTRQKEGAGLEWASLNTALRKQALALQRALRCAPNSGQYLRTLRDLELLERSKARLNTEPVWTQEMASSGRHWVEKAQWSPPTPFRGFSELRPHQFRQGGSQSPAASKEGE